MCTGKSIEARGKNEDCGGWDRGVARETHPPATSPASLKILRGSFSREFHKLTRSIVEFDLPKLIGKVRIAGMKRPKTDEPSRKVRKLRPALTPEAREGQLIALATDLVEERLRNGTATSQEVVHFLRLGSMRERLERERLENENILLRAKTESLESQARIEELYANAIKAMQRYSGNAGESEEDETDY